jgi:hypothetical protein
VTDLYVERLIRAHKGIAEVFELGCAQGIYAFCTFGRGFGQRAIPKSVPASVPTTKPALMCL